MKVPLLSSLRNLALKHVRVFSCCAGCDALPVPVGNRLCVSIEPRWQADAVLPHGWDTEQLPGAVASVRAAMPWLRRIHVPAGGMNAPEQSVHPLPEGIQETNLYCLESLAEHFLVLHAGRLPAMDSFLPTDFFTPNGIPLLFVKPGGSAEAPNFRPGPAAGRTKSLCALFAESCAHDPAADEHCGAAGYAETFARWAYTECHGILAPGPFAA